MAGLLQSIYYGRLIAAFGFHLASGRFLRAAETLRRSGVCLFLFSKVILLLTNLWKMPIFLSTICFWPLQRWSSLL